MQRLKKLCEDALFQYPQTLEQDMEILLLDDEKKEVLSFNERNCVLFRSGEKEILHFYIELCDYSLAVFGMKFREAKLAMQVLPNYFVSARDYF